MVRARPEVSDFLMISLVCLRVSVILFFGSTEPCDLRRYSSSRDLSLSVSESSGARFSTPAARSCSSSTVGGILNSLANCATLVMATLLRLLDLRGAVLLEPVRPRRHDQALGALLLDAGHFRELVHGEVGEVVARLHAARGQLGGEVRFLAPQLQAVLLQPL